jgi:hypothetical protein
LHHHRYLCSIVVLVCFLTSADAGEASETRDANADWYACEVSEDCSWTLGEGGWPAAVRAESISVFLEWVETRAPFTTYFMPGDCFERDEEFQDYIARSKSAVSCAHRRCALTVTPVCTR